MLMRKGEKNGSYHVKKRKTFFFAQWCLFNGGGTMVGQCRNEKAFMSMENANIGIDGNFFVSGNYVDQISTMDMLQK